MRPVRFRTLWFVVPALAVGVLNLSAVGWWNREAIRDWYGHHQQTRQFRAGDDLVARDFANGCFRAGTPVEEVTAAYPPGRVYRQGEFVTLVYLGDPDMLGDEIRVVARHGRLVSASHGGFCETHVFFNTLTPSERDAQHDGMMAEIGRRDEERKRATHAVAGPAGILYWHW